MCLIAWRTGAALAWPLVLAANRDEFHGRATEPLHRWQQSPSLIAGRDRVGGGTWLGVSRQADRLRVAMLTNVRDGRAGPVAADAPSRGLLVTDVLVATGSAPAALQAVAARATLPRMAGFNLVAIDLMFAASGHQQTLSIESGYLAHRGPGQPAAPVLPIDEGVHGLSNGRLDEPWPKTRQLKRALADAAGRLDVARELGRAAAQPGVPDAACDQSEASLLAALGDRRPAPDEALPDTGIDRERERWLSSTFIVDERYGTRCSTVLTVDRLGRLSMLERRFDASGRALGDSRERD